MKPVPSTWGCFCPVVEVSITDWMRHPVLGGGTLGPVAQPLVPESFSSPYLALTPLWNSSNPITSLMRFVNNLLGV